MISPVGLSEITEDWLRECGFRWEQFDRQPEKQWTLWLGWACLEYEPRMFKDSTDLGIELSKSITKQEGYRQLWHCWIRNDIAGRYSRIIHVRHLCFRAEVEELVTALTGRKVDWKDAMYGSLLTPADAERLRRENERLDRKINHAWVDRVDSEKGVSEIDKAKRGVQLP